MKTTFPLAFLAAAPAAFAGPTLTIYNGDLAVVRDSLPLELKAGENSVTYDQATAQVMPDSVILRDMSEKNSFSILEQGYRNDPISQGLLLNHFEGQTIDFRTNYPDGKVEVKPGRIVRSGYVPGGRAEEPVIEMDGKVHFSLPGKPMFPELGNDSILRPALSWKIGAESPAKFDAQLSYLSHGFSWEATYNIVAPEQSETVSLTGWVTVANHSGTAFQNALLKLVAGDVNVVKDKRDLMLYENFFGDENILGRHGLQVEEKAFDDFHLYTLARPVTLRDQETKQVEFQRAPQVKAAKKYVFDATGGENPSDKKIATYWEFRNDEASGLGMALPAGKVRFYRADGQDGNLEFVGENQIKHTPKDEKLSLFTGYAFDLTAERKVVNRVEHDLQSWRDESVEVTVKNHSKTAKEVVIREHSPGRIQWTMLTNSDPFTKVDAKQFEFTVKLAPDEEKTISYTVHGTW